MVSSLKIVISSEKMDLLKKKISYLKMQDFPLPAIVSLLPKCNTTRVSTIFQLPPHVIRRVHPRPPDLHGIIARSQVGHDQGVKVLAGWDRMREGVLGCPRKIGSMVIGSVGYFTPKNTPFIGR